MNKRKIEQGIRKVLEGLLGPEWRADQNYLETPQRVARFYEEMFRLRGYECKTFPERHEQMIILAHHQEFTLCPHHLLPVEFDISLAYIPTESVLGVSKLVRLVQNHFSEPILQETLTDSIANELMSRPKPKPLGSAVLIYGVHDCMKIRGARTSAEIMTSAVRGVFLEKQEVREEFLSLVRRT